MINHSAKFKDGTKPVTPNQKRMLEQPGAAARKVRGGSAAPRLFRSACWVAIIVGLMLGAYLCLRPSGELTTLSWLPDPLERWADRHGRLRNLPAFAALALPFMCVANGRRARRKAFFGLAAFSAGLELAQHFIPTRLCEWQDIMWSWIGLGFTWLGFEIFRLALGHVQRLLRQRNRRRSLPGPASFPKWTAPRIHPQKKSTDRV
jgi:hypothetical protein